MLSTYDTAPCVAHRTDHRNSLPIVMGITERTMEMGYRGGRAAASMLRTLGVIMATASYEHGASATPLSGETLGESLRHTVERFGEREALVVRHQGYRATYAELWEQVGLA